MQGWKLNQSLQRINDHYQVGGELAAQLKRTLWHDLSAEYHAENLCQRLHRADFGPTTELKSFLVYWRQDEWKHYTWMAELYGAAFKLSTNWIKKTLAREKADFSDIEVFFVDEFTVLVLFAYDEILTVLSYETDRLMYKTVDAALLPDFNRIIADESNHFNNACDLLRRKHANRLAEIPTVLTKIEEWERSKRAYGNTFLLDRRESQVFQKELLNKACDILKKRLSL